MKITNQALLFVTLPLWCAMAQQSEGQGGTPQDGGQSWPPPNGQGGGPPPKGQGGQQPPPQDGASGEFPPPEEQQGGQGGQSSSGNEGFPPQDGQSGAPADGQGEGSQPPGGVAGGNGNRPERTYVPYTIEGTPCAETSLANEDLCTAWVLNKDGQVSDYIAGAVVNVEAVTLNQDESVLTVYANGIPSYEVTMTQDKINSLNARPLAASDFTNGITTATDGEVVAFGENIGYTGVRCSLGYWAPGPECPDATYKTLSFPTRPTEAVDEDDICKTGLNVIGLFVNGVSIFGWGDGQSYNKEEAWMNLAVKFEILDLDICGGHAAQKEYHHHLYSECVQQMVGDDGQSGHSPIIGMMGDGYFVYGNHQDAGVTAQSCWRTRDYANPDDPLGCGGDGSRTCVLVNNKDPNAGTAPAEKNGPSVTETVQSMSGNSFVVESGFYYEDYYFDADCYAQGGEYLDEHNGHSHGDYGYHYHVTDSLPYTPGPDSLYGKVVNQQSFCGGTVGPANGAGGGPPTDSGVTDGSGEFAASSNFEAQASESQSSGSTKMSVTFLAMVAVLFVAMV